MQNNIQLSEYLIQVDTSKPVILDESSLATKYSFPLDPFQTAALSAINKGENVLVTAKTGSGKTLVGEYLIHHILRKGGRVFYTTPIKSLSNQKFNDLKKIYGANDVGIMTGDIKFNPDARVIIMTTEILRNLLFKEGTKTESLGITASLSLKGLQGVVFDEVHYINDPSRGRVWEETMILLKPEIQLVLLSATIDHPEFFASWLGALKKVPIHLISTEYRIVPLTHTVICGKYPQTLMDAKNIYDDGIYRRYLEWRNKGIKDHEAFQKKVKEQRRAGDTKGPVEGKTRPASFTHSLNELIVSLEEQTLLPALVFVFSRAGCESYASKVQATLLDSSDAAKIRHIWNFHLHGHKNLLEKSPQAHALLALAERGIAYHHSGLQPLLKEIVEILFSRGFIKLLFATETFAVGLNMPTKTAIFLDLKKYCDDVKGLRLLRTDEYLQMAGRAGRRGLDTQGTVIYFPEREPLEPSEMKAILTGSKNSIQSKMQFHYDFLLKTIQKGLSDALMTESYWYQQRRQEEDRILLELKALKMKLEAFKLNEDDINEHEKFLELSNDVKFGQNAKKKQAQKALDVWKAKNVGPRWALIAKEYDAYMTLQKEIRSLEAEIASLKNNKEGIQEQLNFLKATKYLTEDADPVLSEKGIIATEINEGHQIMMTELYTAKKWTSMEPEELVATLMAFQTEGSKKDELPPLDRLQVPKVIVDVLYDLDAVTAGIMELEYTSRTQSPSGYWDLCSFWIEPIYVYFKNSEELSVLCAQYGLFEGNFIRTLNKAKNLVEEWTSLATYYNDVEGLELCKKMEQLFLKTNVTPDSLYLRLN